MPDTTFETLLSGQLREYAETGVRPIDRFAIAEATIAGGRAHKHATGAQILRRWTRGSLTPLVAALLLLGLLIALIGALLLPGSRRTLPAVVAPTASVTPAPVAVEVTPGPSDPPPSFPATSKPIPGQGVMTRVGDMTTARIEPIAVTLGDRRVLIVGGFGDQDLKAEVFDPSTGQFAVTGPDGIPGDGSGVLLPDGRVFIVTYNGAADDSTEYLLDPQTMTWTRVRPPNSALRRDSTVTMLHDGRVLITGGEVRGTPASLWDVVDSAEIFDPATETFAPTGSMLKPRVGHSATTLPDGRVLVAGGQGLCDTVRSGRGECTLPDLRDAEIWDPATGTFTPGGPMSGIEGPTQGLLLADGRVLVLQMSILSIYSSTVASDGPGVVETFDPASGTFTLGPPSPHKARTATLLPDGRVFLTAQWDLPDGAVPLYTTWAGIYDPTTGLTQDAAAPPAGWQQPALLADGRILLVGGQLNREAIVPWAELYKWR